MSAMSGPMGISPKTRARADVMKSMVIDAVSYEASVTPSLEKSGERDSHSMYHFVVCLCASLCRRRDSLVFIY